MHNQMALKMASASKGQLSKLADKTAEVLFVEGGPDGKVTQAATAAAAATIKRKLKTDENNMKNQLEEAKVEASRMKALLQQEKTKRQKLEAKLNASEPSSSSKATRGPAKGANQNNQTGNAMKQNPSSRKNHGKHKHREAGDANKDDGEKNSYKHKNRNKNYWQKKKNSKKRKSAHDSD